MRETPSCQVFKISTMDMSAILNPSEFTLVKKEIFQGSRQSEKRKLFTRTSRKWKAPDLHAQLTRKVQEWTASTNIRIFIMIMCNTAEIKPQVLEMLS